MTESALVRDFAALLGGDRVRLAQGQQAAFASVAVEAANADEIGAIVRKCETDRIALAPAGAGRTLAQMRGTPVAIAVSLARMQRIVSYDPADMTILVEAGAALDAINQVTAAHGQRLPADPPLPATTSIGALIASAKAGPLRLSEGTVRDLLIGIRFVGHDGRLVHAGGNVVKNVAGYDLMKVMTGSFGTLGIITEAAFKVRPIPPNYRLATANYATIDEAFTAASKALQAVPLIHCEVVSRHLGFDSGDSARFTVAAGFAGVSAAIEYQSPRVRDALGVTTLLRDGTEASTAYERLRDVARADSMITAQLAVLPAELPRVLTRAAAAGEVEFCAHAGSGVAQLYRLADGVDATVATIARWREMASEAGGHLRLVAAPAEIRGKVAIFPTPPAPALALMRRLKAAFDPHGIFNPGCFVGGL